MLPAVSSEKTESGRLVNMPCGAPAQPSVRKAFRKVAAEEWCSLQRQAMIQTVCSLTIFLPI